MMAGTDTPCDCGAPAQTGRRLCSRCRYLASPAAEGRRRYAPRHSEPDEDLGPELPPAPVLPLRPCIGCGLRPVEGPVYCSTCRHRLAYGTPLDLESFPTQADADRLRRREASEGRAPAGFNRPTPAPLAVRLRAPHRRGRR